MRAASPVTCWTTEMTSQPAAPPLTPTTTVTVEVCVCVCVRERERESEGGGSRRRCERGKGWRVSYRGRRGERLSMVVQVRWMDLGRY